MPQSNADWVTLPGRTPEWLFRCSISFPLVLLPHQHATPMIASEGEEKARGSRGEFCIQAKNLQPLLLLSSDQPNPNPMSQVKCQGGREMQFSSMAKKRKRKQDLNKWHAKRMLKQKKVKR